MNDTFELKSSEQQKIEKLLDDFTNRVLETTLQIVNQKQVEIDYWRKKAITFSKKFKVCLECSSRKGYSPETMKCKNCLEYERSRS